LKLDLQNSNLFKKNEFLFSSRVKKSIILLLLSFFLILGFSITAFWFGKFEKPYVLWQHIPLFSFGLLLTMSFTLINIGLRWVRWHFLTRRVGANLTARESLLTYLATLPAILTPFYIGELIRAVLLGKKYPNIRSDIVGIWFLERSSDLLVLSVFATPMHRHLLLVLSCIVFWIITVVGIKIVYKSRKLLTVLRPLQLFALLLITYVTWVFPGIALWVIMWLLKNHLHVVTTVGIFAYSTILGSITGLPIGTGVTGSSIILYLQQHGIVLDNAIIGTFVFRAGTAWFAILLGIIVIIFYRYQLWAIFGSGQSKNHFDEIAEEYREEIPNHVRERLIMYKIYVMQHHLKKKSLFPNSRGLDFGSGQCWYACEMAKAGYEMFAVDISKKQLQHAQRYIEQQGVKVHCKLICGTSLPFPDNYFDFAYAINVFHHMNNKEEQVAVLQDIVRVLKPTGVFFLQEINTINPLFRFYMGYIFPLIRIIDEGTEKWINPRFLPFVKGARWSENVDYFTFFPDFVPSFMMNTLLRAEKYLALSPLRHFSAHYAARLIKNA
jgi:ubiquinone/menaquinone biosynthesis C-methylase UbiE/uncharacterized membrane protein YbhN (UPF0104 family)